MAWPATGSGVIRVPRCACPMSTSLLLGTLTNLAQRRCLLDATPQPGPRGSSRPSRGKRTPQQATLPGMLPPPDRVPPRPPQPSPTEKQKGSIQSGCSWARPPTRPDCAQRPLRSKGGQARQEPSLVMSWAGGTFFRPVAPSQSSVVSGRGRGGKA